LKEARAGSGSTSHQPDPSTSPEPLDDDDDMMGLITEQQNQIQDLEEKLRQAEDTIRDLEQASQPGPAESEAPAAMTTLSPEVKGHLETIATTLSSEETEIVAPDQPDELNGFLARVVDGINHLNRELADALELSEVITVLQEQVVEAEVDNENLSNEVGELKEQLGGLQTELGELKELLAEKDEVIAEQQLQLIDPPS
jgi:chromosome segregation ATPase